MRSFDLHLQKPYRYLVAAAMAIGLRLQSPKTLAEWTRPTEFRNHAVWVLPSARHRITETHMGDAITLLREDHRAVEPHFRGIWEGRAECAEDKARHG
jgi:hypothetical protein